MLLLKLTIFSGGLFLIDLFFLALVLWFLYQANAWSKKYNYSITKSVKLWLAIASIVLWIVSMIVRAAQI